MQRKMHKKTSHEQTPACWFDPYSWKGSTVYSLYVLFRTRHSYQKKFTSNRWANRFLANLAINQVISLNNNSSFKKGLSYTFHCNIWSLTGSSEKRKSCMHQKETIRYCIISSPFQRWRAVFIFFCESLCRKSNEEKCLDSKKLQYLKHLFAYLNC